MVASTYEYYLFFPEDEIVKKVSTVETGIQFLIFIWWLPLYLFWTMVYVVIALVFVTYISK